MWATQFHPEKSSRHRPAPARQLRRRVRAGADVMELYPAIDLRGGAACGSTRATSTGRPCTATTRWRQAAALRRRRARRGSTSSTSTRPAPASRATARVVAAIAAAGRRCRCRPAAASATRRRGRCSTPASARVVVGTAALEDPDARRRAAPTAGRPVAVGLDARGREVAVRGWAEGSGRDLLDVAARVRRRRASRRSSSPRSGATARCAGPDLDGLAERARRHQLDVIASRRRRLARRPPRPSRARGRRPAAGRGDRRHGALRGPLHRRRGASPRCGAACDARPG